MKFRDLYFNEIQVRPTDTKYKGKATLLLYQSARAAMDILANRNVSPSVVASALGDDVAIALKYYCKILPQTIINEQIKCLEKNY